MNARNVAMVAVLALAPLAADAQSFRCVGNDGKRYYGSAIPAECYGRPVEQLSAQGTVTKRIDPAASEKDRLVKEAADAKKRETDNAARETARRNRALLATYTNEKDIDDARARALAENTKAISEVESNLETIRKRQSGYQKELEALKDKGEAPMRLRDDLKSAQDELTAQQQLLQTKRRDTDHINARYDDDMKRYLELNGKSASDRGVALGARRF